MLKNQDSFKNYLDDFYKMGNIEEIGKKNMALFEQTMGMFFPKVKKSDKDDKKKDPPEEVSKKTSQKSEKSKEDLSLDSLKSQLDILQKQINDIKKDK